MRLSASVVAACLAASLSAGCGKKGSNAAADAGLPPPSAQATAGRTVFDGRCAGCHTIGGGDRTGPDLKFVGKRREADWLKKWLKNPVAMGDSDHLGKELSARFGGVIMPDPGLSEGQIDQVLAFIADASERGGYEPTALPPRTLAGAELEKAKTLYFDRCAGCHGALRQGATGPALTPDRTKDLGAAKLRATLNHGRPGGMPNWGELGILSTDDVDLLANYLQMPPAARPQLSLDEMRQQWNLKVDPKDRPKEPAHKRNWKNFFAIVLNDPGQVAILDGDTKERLSLLDVGFGVEQVRASASGRYLYALQRDGRVSLIDLWMSPPTIVAQARGCFDARSIEASKAKTHVDKLLAEGCYWPPQLAYFDGVTLEPKATQNVLPAPESGTKLDEVRVGSLLARADKPIWAATLMETGEVALLDYSKPGVPISARIAAEKQLLDGTLDPSGRYLLAAVPTKNQVAVVDLDEQKLVTATDTGKSPHLDPGASYQDAELGWVLAVPHIGEAKLTIVGADPKGHPDRAWKVVRKVDGVAAGSLFAVTHPKSPWVWVDSPANPKPDLARQVCVIAKKDGKLHKCWQASAAGRVMHFEYDQEGTEVWISGWDKKGAILVYQDAELKEATRIEGDWLVTPTLAYNVTSSAGGEH